MPRQRVKAPLSGGQCSVKVGQLVGNYRVEEVIGRGGMGVVFRAVHKDIGRKAAIKALDRDFARDPEFVTRFLNEARAVNLIGHPGLVEIFEFGCLPDETPYIIMEFLEGLSLGQRLERGGRARRTVAAQALTICRQIAVALAAAHDKGVVHRDLKPENVMLIEDALAPGTERVKILDFGLAKFENPGDAKGPSLTQTGVTMGSPLYMAPEQCQELATVTDRADVYSLGVILYELLSGRPPYVSDLSAEIMVMHVRSSPPPLRAHAPQVPVPVADLVQHMLAKEPTKRPSMHKVAEALGKLSLTGPAAGASSQPGLPRRTLELGVGGAIAVVAALAVLFIGWRRERPAAAPPLPGPQDRLLPASEGQAAPEAPRLPTIEWTILTYPAGAQVLDEISSYPLGQTPLKLRRPRRAGRQTVRLHLSGYRDVTLELDGERDLLVERQLISLSQLAAPQAGGKAARKPHNKDDLLAPPF
jgi:tRNA A-37 threonylcarbamoyl transferase component Bud32